MHRCSRPRHAATRSGRSASGSRSPWRSSSSSRSSPGSAGTGTATWTGRRWASSTPLYYATVSITTTGYGDITPVTTGTRLATTIIITPARILFLILLVGTTLEVLAEGSRQAFRQRSWRRRLHDHTIVCGYGTKGRSAIAVLRAKGVDAEQIVVIDPRADHVAEANRAGHAGVDGRRDARRGPRGGGRGGRDRRHRGRRPRRHRGAHHAHRPGAQQDREDLRRRARGGEHPPPAPGRRGLGDPLVRRDGAPARLQHHRAARRRGARGPPLRGHRPRHPRARGHHGRPAAARGDPLHASRSSRSRGTAGCCASTTLRPPSCARATASSAW